MAERRMFTKKITESDAFLDMPCSTQVLYFHLNMSADDDGFVNNPKKIQRMVGCSDDDMKLLILKSFIIVFESGVIVIKHWKMHNYIQSDRYKPTDYTDEKSLLEIKRNKAYTLAGGDATEIPENTDDSNNVYKMDTDCVRSVSVGKDRLGKDRLGKVRDKDIEKESTKESPPYFDVENAWIETYKIYPKKSGEATAKVEWMKKVGHSLDIKEVSKLVFYATKLYLSDYSGRYPDDANYKYLPRYDKWLQEDCDYWIRQYEEKQRGDDS